MAVRSSLIIFCLAFFVGLQPVVNSVLNTYFFVFVDNLVFQFEIHFNFISIGFAWLSDKMYIDVVMYIM